jgi:signal transduction histidine kinase
VALAGLAAAIGAYRLSLAGDYGRLPHVHAALVAWIVVAYVGCGLIAWSRRPESLFGPLLVTAGLVPALSRLAEADAAVLQLIGESLLLLPAVLFVHVFLAYPSGRLVRPLERLIVVSGYAIVLGFDLLRMVLEIIGQSGDLALQAQRVGTGVVALGAVAALISRRRASAERRRRSIRLLIACFGLAMVALVAGTVMISVGAPGRHEMRWIAFALVGIAPVLLLVGHLRARLARSALGDFCVELRSDPTPADLELALARALGDPTLTLAHWLPEFGSYADSEGREVTLPEPTESRAVTHVERDGSRVAALLHDRSLEEEPELLDSVAAALSLSLENTQLHVELRARLEELRGSRARILDSAQRERQRLERNLHDGAQQRLVALSLDLRLLEEQLDGDRSATQQICRARSEVAASLEELREIAHGIHPAVVTGHGLAVALEQLAARAAVPVRLTVGVRGRLPEAVEVASYYVVAEGLTNVGKYAQASAATVEVLRTAGLLVVEVNDDGIGGANTERGSGLRGLADRVEALGGRLRVWSPVGGGTRVQAEIPCA